MKFFFNIQTSVYTDAVQKARGQSKWLAIIDVDEYLVPVCEDTINDVLEKHYDFVSGLCVNWQLYGTSHIYEIGENELMIDKLTYKARVDHPSNFLYKSIVQPLHVTYCPNPHFCHYVPGHWHLNANYQQFVDQNPGVYIDKIRINHYWSKDEKFFFEVKVPREEKWGVWTKEKVLEVINEYNQEEDRVMDRFIPKLRQRLGL